ncbi:hypothetical protein ACUUL3_15085 [Thiovibrio sp. JS02]
MIPQVQKSWHALFFMLLLAISLTMAGCAASQSGPSALADGTMITKGKVKAIANDLVTIKPPKGDAVTVRLTADTKFDGLDSAKAIKKGNAFEVRYKLEGAENIAISVKAIAEGSC